MGWFHVSVPGNVCGNFSSPGSRTCSARLLEIDEVGLMGYAHGLPVSAVLVRQLLILGTAHTRQQASSSHAIAIPHIQPRAMLEEHPHVPGKAPLLEHIVQRGLT